MTEAEYKARAAQVGNQPLPGGLADDWVSDRRALAVAAASAALAGVVAVVAIGWLLLWP